MTNYNYTREEAEKILKERFNIEHFKDSQWEGIKHILHGERVLMIQPTGFGKSLCFQFPATVFDGLTLVISPLIALMKDQVKNLKKKGISAEFLNTSIKDKSEKQRILQDAIHNKIKMLYIAPERMDNDEWQEAFSNMTISFVVIDEAHCISSWGHVFRPSYRRLVNFLPESCPVLAVTATANRKTQEDIESQIGHNVITIRGDLTRKNIALQVSTVTDDNQVFLSLAQYLQTAPGSGIVYAGSKMRTEIFSDWLNFVGIPAINFYGTMDSEDKNAVLEDLMQNKWKAIVSTSALGMGIDKPDVAFVVHTQIPESPIHYYQEVGRAGRDGSDSQALLIYNTDLTPDGIPEGMSMSYSFVQDARPELYKYEAVIESLKENKRSTQKSLGIDTNIKQKSMKTIVEDLVDQGIVRCVREKELVETKLLSLPSCNDDFNKAKSLTSEQMATIKSCLIGGRMSVFNLCREAKVPQKVLIGLAEEGCLTMEIERKEQVKQFLEYIPDAPSLSTVDFTSQKRDAMEDLKQMEAYVTTKEPRMGFLCHYLDSYENKCHQNCDNTILSKFAKFEYHSDSILEAKLKKFQENTFPTITVRNPPKCLLPGVAAGYYGKSEIGARIRASKYCNIEPGEDYPDFDDYLVEQTVKAFKSKYEVDENTFILFVPPTIHRNLVKNFATKVAKVLGCDINDAIIKTKKTDEQKKWVNTDRKVNEIKDAFDYVGSNDLGCKRIILIDDICDSGATIAEIAKMLGKKGAQEVIPLVIAKTVGGDKL